MCSRKLTVGEPRKPETKLGALISKEHLAKVRAYVRLAREEGATVKCGEGIDLLDLEEENSRVGAHTINVGPRDTHYSMSLFTLYRIVL